MSESDWLESALVGWRGRTRARLAGLSLAAVRLLAQIRLVTAPTRAVAERTAGTFVDGELLLALPSSATDPAAATRAESAVRAMVARLAGWGAHWVAETPQEPSVDSRSTSVGEETPLRPLLW